MNHFTPRLVAVFLALAAMPVVAQTSQQTTRSSRAPATQPPVPEAQGVTQPQVRAATDAHLANMRGRLKITPAQMPQWDVFATISRENAEEMHDRFERRRAALGRFDASQNMTDFAQISELHARHLVRLAAAFQALYATMPADQQREADTYFREIRTPQQPARPRPTSARAVRAER